MLKDYQNKINRKNYKIRFWVGIEIMNKLKKIASKLNFQMKKEILNNIKNKRRRNKMKYKWMTE